MSKLSQLVRSFIPMVGMVINFLECGCNPGTLGENRYGPDPVPDPDRETSRPPITSPGHDRCEKLHGEASETSEP